MDVSTIVRWESQLSTLMEGKVDRIVCDAVDEVIEAGELDLLSHLLLTATEFSARRIIDALAEREVFEPLVPAACIRREVGRSVTSGPSELSSKRIFRDFEKPEEGEPGVPDHIMEEAEAISSHADQTRRISAQKEAELDRDAVRHHIVEVIEEQMNTSEDAMEAMIAIARSSTWEETARMAAMRIGNNKVVMGRITRAGRINDLVAIGDASGSQAVRTMIARSLADTMPDSSDSSYRQALEFVAEHHPAEGHRRAAREALGG